MKYTKNPVIIYDYGIIAVQLATAIANYTPHQNILKKHAKNIEIIDFFSFNFFSHLTLFFSLISLLI